MQLLQTSDARRNLFIVQLERHLERAQALEGRKRLFEKNLGDDVMVDVTHNEIARCKNVVEVCTIGLQVLMVTSRK